MNKRFEKIIGTGGIGVGLLFETSDNRTLGRNESRLVHLSDAKDYCKQHIVLHYAASLMPDNTKIFPVGFIGRDAYGASLLKDMERVGMSMQFVNYSESTPTTISFCLQYPDKDGCNITASNGASDLVTPDYIRMALDEIGVDQNTLLAAIPEVRVEARIEMLSYGHAHGGYCVLSIPEAEAYIFEQFKVFQYCDLLSVNEREAAALMPGADNVLALISQLYQKVSVHNPHVQLLVTCGKNGAYIAQSDRIELIPPLSVNAINTTGAGDAFLGGVIAGLAGGLPLQKGHNDQTFAASPLTSAAELGTLCAGMAVESPDTIASHVHSAGILARIVDHQWQQSAQFRSLLGNHGQNDTLFTF